MCVSVVASVCVSVCVSAYKLHRVCVWKRKKKGEEKKEVGARMRITLFFWKIHEHLRFHFDGMLAKEPISDHFSSYKTREKTFSYDTTSKKSLLCHDHELQNTTFSSFCLTLLMLIIIN